MIELVLDICRKVYKPLLLVLLSACLVLLWYVPREHQTNKPMWVEIIADPKNNHCEVTLWEGGRMVYSMTSEERYDLVTKSCQIYVINH